jgi:RHS repeat-associated protein
LHRLIGAVNPSDAAQTQTFQYDDVGNVTYNSRIGTYEYPDPGSIRPHAPQLIIGANGAQPIAYDANGNLVNGRGRIVQWSVDNLPEQINGTVFSYDGFGRRLTKTSPGSESIFPFGNDYEIADGMVIKYVSVDGIGLIAKRVGAQAFWIHTDRLGSIQAITDSTGAAVQRRTYRPYGEKIADAFSHTESRGYIGERQDEELDLAYLHARYYDPALALFLSPDPVGADPSSYRYGLGDPVNLSDPTGLMANCGSLSQWLNTQSRPYGIPANTPTTASVTVEARGGPGIECSFFDSGPLSADERLRLGYDPSGLPRLVPGNPSATPPPSATPTPPTPTPTPICEGAKCPRFLPTGLGVQIEVAGEKGYGAAGVSGQASGGAIITMQGVGGFLSGGAFLGPLTNLFTTSPSSGLVVGSSAGTSLQIFITNARRPADLAGPFSTLSISAGRVAIQVGYDSATGTYTAGAGPSLGGGLSGSLYTTAATASGLCWVGSPIC